MLVLVLNVSLIKWFGSKVSTLPWCCFHNFGVWWELSEVASSTTHSLGTDRHFKSWVYRHSHAETHSLGWASVLWNTRGCSLRCNLELLSDQAVTLLAFWNCAGSTAISRSRSKFAVAAEIARLNQFFWFDFWVHVHDPRLVELSLDSLQHCQFCPCA